MARIGMWAWIRRCSSSCSSGVSMVEGLLLHGVGELKDARDQSPLAGGEHALVGVGKAGEIELREFLQGVLGLQKARLQFARRGTERGHRGVAGRRRSACADRAAAPRASRASSAARHAASNASASRVRSPCRTIVSASRGCSRGGQARQGVRGGGRQPPRIEVARGLGAEPLAERQAPIHPPAPATEQLGDLRGREVIVGGEGVDHASFVHRAHGALGRVRLEQPGLADHAAERIDFHDHGDVGGALAAPAGQPLEAIEDLVGAVADRRRAHGQRGQRGAGLRARAAQGRERRGQPIDGDVEDRAHGRSSDSARS